MLKLFKESLNNMNITTIYDSRQLEKTADLIPTSSKLKAAIRSLFSYCSTTSQNTFVCHPKQRTIAARAGVCLKTVSRAVGFLCASGVLTVEDQYYQQDGQARRTSCFYTVHLDRLKDLINSRFKNRKVIRKQRVTANSVSNTCPSNKQKGSLNKKKKAVKPSFIWMKKNNISSTEYEKKQEVTSVDIKGRRDTEAYSSKRIKESNMIQKQKEAALPTQEERLSAFSKAIGKVHQLFKRSGMGLESPVRAFQTEDVKG